MAAQKAYIHTHQKNLVVPQDPVTRDSLLAVDRKTKYDMGQIFGFGVDHDWYCNTIANATMECIIANLGNIIGVRGVGGNFRNGDGATAYNFYNLFTVYATMKQNDNAEKEGNINIAFKPGSHALALIGAEEADNDKELERRDPVEFFSLPDDPAIDKHYREMDRQARFNVSEKYSVVLSDKLPYTAFGTLYLFIENIFKDLLYTLGSDPDKTLASINFNDNVEIHAMRKDGGIVFSMRPGMNAKLIIKSDKMTESEVGGDIED